MGYGMFGIIGCHLHFVVIVVVVVVFVLLGIIIPSCEAQLEFKWIAGRWGDCAPCGPGGRQYREVWCVLRTGSEQAVEDRNCEPDFKPAGGRECFNPCTQDVILGTNDVYPGETNPGGYSKDYPDYEPGGRDYPGHTLGQHGGVADGRDFPLSSATSDVEWVASQWSSCQLKIGAEECGRNSGMRYRNVTCQRKHSTEMANPARCEASEPKPPISQSCEFQCRQDCVVSEYSDWMECDSECQRSSRTRIRRVIVPPRHLGSVCPALSEMEVCPNCTQSYTFEFSDWLPCTYIKDQHMIGYQSREINCLKNKGTVTAYRQCLDKLSDTLTKKYRSCVIPQDCQVSAWSALRPHNASCMAADGQVMHGYMVRTRQVLQLPLGDGYPCPSKLTDYIKLNKEEINLLRPCKKARWITSSWSVCQSVPGYNHCGTGMQTCKAICLEAGDDGVERPVDESRCPSVRPQTARSCTMECNWDCSVSQWSAWSTCQDTDCGRSMLRKKRVDVQTGKRFRTREILTRQGPGGKPCPHLSETKACQPEPCFTWNVTLGPCQAHRGDCGEGSQSVQQAACLNRAGEKVRERDCHQSLQIEQNNKWVKCYVPCAEDCVLSEWGNWSPCPDPCMSRAGVRSMRTRMRQILAYHGQGRSSRPCPNPNALREMDACPVLYDCATYRWEVSDWGACMLNVNSETVKCGHGTQSRTVDCYASTNEKAVDEKCELRVKPKNTQSCIVECPIDCHVTMWSQWSDCGVTCLLVQARQIYPTQVRFRFVRQYPENGGLTCPSDLVEEQSCLDLPLCQTYYWQTTEWSECVVPPAPEVGNCGQGLRGRNISCYHATDKESQQVPFNLCLENLGTMPDVTETCYIPCESECQLTLWSQWTHCGPRCETTRFRYRGLLATSKSMPECRDPERYPTFEEQECFCDSLQPVAIGGWSDCIIQSDEGLGERFASMSLKSISTRYRRNNETGLGGFGPQDYCGKGKRYMAFTCADPHNDGHGTPRCAGEDYQEEECEIPCPVDCQYTEWSPWSKCNALCGSGLQQRKRRIRAHASAEGRRCSNMNGNDEEIQTRVCREDCSYFVWRTEEWGPCVPSNNKACGDGTHSRPVRCVSVGYDGTEIQMDEGYCEREEKTLSIKPCTLPCPGECVMSEWSEWTICRQPCNGGKQSRERTVLRMPASYAISRACSYQREERPCERGKNCQEYAWHDSPWTSCLVNGGEAECGVGHKEKYVTCRNQSGEKVEEHRCLETEGPNTNPLVVSCQIPCDTDCLLSDWSEWSPCNTTCGLGFTQRRRTILQNPTENGRQCPPRLDQLKPCFLKGCFRWSVSDWSHCMAQRGVCGSGVQERNVSCTNEEGRPVNSSKCPVDPEKLVMQTSRPCHVPCPGECKLSEWSKWSDCYISCEDFEQGFTIGVQARSRAILAHPVHPNPPCNGTLWEDRTCEAQQCTWFRWVASDWNMMLFARNVHCERHDGLRVSGGCDERKRPATTLTCTQPKCIKPAKCVDSDVCVCSEADTKKGFVPHYLNQTAVTCIMNNTATVDEEEAAAVAKSPNVWMYAVIAVGTLFVIAVTAALYNMCKPSPRPAIYRNQTYLTRQNSAASDSLYVFAGVEPPGTRSSLVQNDH